MGTCSSSSVSVKSLKMTVQRLDEWGLPVPESFKSSSKQNPTSKKTENSITSGRQTTGRPFCNNSYTSVVNNMQLTTKISPDSCLSTKSTPLERVTDEELVAEIASRQIGYIHESVVCDNSENGSSQISLGVASDDHLFEEAQRRNIVLHDVVDFNLVKESYIFGSTIGEGASGTIRLCSHKLTGEKLACKIVVKDNKMNDSKSMSMEVSIMRRANHKNVIATREVFESPNCFWLIMEYAEGGDLREHIANSSKYSVDQAAEHFKQVLNGVHYLHSIGVIHRDLKLDNILLKQSGDADGSYEVKITDFGLSALVQVGENGYHENRSAKRKSFTGLRERWGTPDYKAPEILRGAYGPQVDMWSAGCMLYEILCGCRPFTQRPGEPDLKPLECRVRACQFERDPKLSAWGGLPTTTKAFIKSMIEVDPEARLTATEAMQHPWLNGRAK